MDNPYCSCQLTRVWDETVTEVLANESISSYKTARLRKAGHQFHIIVTGQELLAHARLSSLSGHQFHIIVTGQELLAHARLSSLSRAMVSVRILTDVNVNVLQTSISVRLLKSLPTLTSVRILTNSVLPRENKRASAPGYR